jgi:hypothetical protein
LGRSLIVVRRVGVLSLGKVLGVLYALLGLIVGVLFPITRCLVRPLERRTPRLLVPSPACCSALGPWFSCPSSMGYSVSFSA